MYDHIRVFAYCTALARPAVAQATGVEPLTSPPVTAEGFAPDWLQGYDLLYFRLHGSPGRVGWFGEGDGQTPLALARCQVEAVDLGGAIVVVGNCYSADGDPMVESLYKAGARAVIGGRGPNLAAGNRVVGTDLLVQWLLWGLRMGMSAGRALEVARGRLLLTVWRAADRDAFKFKVITKKEAR